jgi:hypothetical protein
MLKSPKLWLALATAICAGCANGGCTGPKGDMGPSGAAGSSAPNTTPIYYYNNNFDTAANLNEWTVYLSAGPGSISTYLDSSVFNSPGTSMGISVTGSVSADSIVYTSLSFDNTKDIWVEFDWNLNGTSSVNTDFVINLGSTVNKADIGYDGTHIYLIQSASQINVLSNPTTTQWHHVKIALTPSTGKSSYWFDGLNLGSNYSTNITPGGTPPAGNLIGIKIFPNSGSTTHFDNLQCYHF